MPCCIDRLRFSLGIFRFVTFFFLCIGRCWVVHPDLAPAVNARGRPTGGPALPHLLPGGSSVVEQWTVKCSMQRSIGREFKSPSPDLFLFARLRPAVYRGGGEQAGIFGLVGYDARFTRERSRVRSSEDVVSFFFFFFTSLKQSSRAAGPRIGTAFVVRSYQGEHSASHPNCELKHP